jgi:23S rRNA pseudouridine2605 synthase
MRRVPRSTRVRSRTSSTPTSTSSRRSAPTESERASPGERIQKLLAAAGLASRREAEDWIRAGRVRVDGVVATLGAQADPATQTITLDGHRVGAARPVYWMLHKPRGVLTAVRDARGRRTVIDFLPRGLRRVFPVGRLDLDTEGLVLLTNDGALAHLLLHPSLGSEREYRVTVRGRMEPASLARLASGVELDDGPTAPAQVGSVHFDGRRGTTTLGLVLHEGRKRQIRRALAALGHPVLRLSRTRLGPLLLGKLPAGQARSLTPGEIAALRRHARWLRERQLAGRNGRQATADPGRPLRGGSKRSRKTKQKP